MKASACGVPIPLRVQLATGAWADAVLPCAKAVGHAMGVGTRRDPVHAHRVTVTEAQITQQRWLQ